jgi:molybdenum ABC transporter molybdate-binding protein
MSASPAPRSSRAPWATLAAALALILALALLLVWRPARIGPPVPGAPPLLMYCAAGVRVPVEAVARRYQQEYGVEVQLQFGGANTLLTQIEVSKLGDLYLAGEAGYVESAREKGLVREILPVAHMRPVIAVRRGNKKGVHGLPDLMREDVRVALVNPEAGALGKVVRRVLEPYGVWGRLHENVLERGVYKPNVNDVANDVKLGSVDAGVVWDTTVNLMPELEAVRPPEFAEVREQVTLGVLAGAREPAAALRFARYLTAPERGAEVFRANGFPDTVPGDAWAETPQITVFSGAVNRPAIQQTLEDFARREGVKINTVYAGCGVLVAQMKGLREGESRGAFPDAYFACDLSFMDQVRELFADEVQLTETRMVILTKKGNPKKIHSLADLALPDTKVGLANPEQSALGHLTRELLKAEGLYDAVRRNASTEAPTADLLVNAMKAGSLDAAMVYEANAAHVREALEVVPLTQDKARAVQPYAIARDGAHRQLMRRLLERLRTDESRKQYEAAGFKMRQGAR